MKKLLLAALAAGAISSAATAADVITLPSYSPATNYTFNRVVDRQIAPGVQYIYLNCPTRGTYGTHVYITIADLTNPAVKVEYLTAKGTYGGSTNALATIASNNTSTNHTVVAGANANFWITSEQPWKSQMAYYPHGTAIHGGNTYAQNAIMGSNAHIGGPTATGMIAYTAEGKMKINRYTPTLTLTNTRIGHVLDLRDFNRPVEAGSAVAYNKQWGTSKAFKPVQTTSTNTWEIVSGKCTEMMLSLAPGEKEMSNGRTTKYIVKEIRTNAGTGTLGSYDLAVVGMDITGAPYASFISGNYKVGDELVLTNKFTTDGADWPQVMEATSGNCMTMIDGTILPDNGVTDQTGYNGSVYARTVYGTNDDGTKLIIAVCGNKTSNYYGMKTRDLTAVVKYFGATYASQVDCGGSSQMWVNGLGQVNKSTDSSDVRNVHSGLFVVSTGTVNTDPIVPDDPTKYEIGENVIYQDDPAACGEKAKDSYTFQTEYLDRAVSELSGKTVRRLIARGNYLYILAHDASKNPTVIVYDHVQGKTLRTLGTSACEGDISKLSDIAVTADGYLVGMNKVTQAFNGAGNVKQYYWGKDSNGLPNGEATAQNVVNLVGNFSSGESGESMTWMGTRLNGYWCYTATRTTNTKHDTRIQCEKIGPVTVNGSTLQGACAGNYHNNTEAILAETTTGMMKMFTSPYNSELEYTINGTMEGMRRIPVVESAAGKPTVTEELSVNVAPGNVNHTSFFRYGGKIYIASPNMNGNTNQGFLLIDATNGLASAKQVCGYVLPDYASNTDIATAGVGLVTLVNGTYVESRMALFAVRNGKVTKIITPSVIEEGEDRPDIIGTVGDINFGKTTVGNSVSRSFNIEGVNLTGDITLTLSDKTNFRLSQTKISQADNSANITVTFTPTVRGNISSTLTVSTPGTADKTYTMSGTAELDLKPAVFAYGLTVKAEDNRYDYSFGLSGDAEGVTLVLTDATGKKYEYDQGAMKGGKHTLSVPYSILAPSKYTWEVIVRHSAEPTGGRYFHEDPYKADTRGGVVAIKDTENESFGLVVTSNGYDRGFGVYNPDLTKRGQYFEGQGKWTAATRHSPFRLAYRSNGAVYTIDYADATAGIYVFNPSHPEYGTGNMFQGTMSSTGCWTYNGQALGGGGTGLCFFGEGDNTVLWSAQEDWPGTTNSAQVVVKYDIGNADRISKSPTQPNAQLAKTSLLANNNINLTAGKKGIWVVQNRTAGNNSHGCPGFVYIDNDGNILYNSGDHADIIPSCAGSVAVNKEDNILAVAQVKADVRLYNITWSGNTPSLSLLGTVAGSSNEYGEVSQMDFDYAGNLHIYNSRSTSMDNGGYSAFAVPRAAGVVSTPAPSSQNFDATITCAPVKELAIVTDAAQLNLEGTYTLTSATNTLQADGSAVAAPARGQFKELATVAKVKVAENTDGTFALTNGTTAMGNFTVTVTADGTTLRRTDGKYVAADFTLSDTPCNTLALCAANLRTVADVTTLAEVLGSAEGTVCRVGTDLRVLHAAANADGKSFNVFVTDGATIAAANVPASAFTATLSNTSTIPSALFTATGDALFGLGVVNGNYRGLLPGSQTHSQVAADGTIHSAAGNAMSHIRLQGVVANSGSHTDGYTIAHAYDRQTTLAAAVGHMGIAEITDNDGSHAPVYDIEGFLYTPAGATVPALYISSVEHVEQGYALPDVKMTVGGREVSEIQYLDRTIRFDIDAALADHTVVFYTKDGTDPQTYLTEGVAPVADPAIVATFKEVEALDAAENEKRETPLTPWYNDYYVHSTDWATWAQYAGGKVFYYISDGNDDETSFYIAPRSLWYKADVLQAVIKAIAVVVPQSVEAGKEAHFANSITMLANAFEAPALWTLGATPAQVRAAIAGGIVTGHSDVLATNINVDTTGLETLSADDDSEAVYYDLRGISHGSDRRALTPGVYLRRTPAATTKVVVK